ncbi:MAG: hypothetical protein ACR2HR_08275 [Euzebya sp.]
MVGEKTPILDGEEVLRDLALNAGYASLPALLASHTIFLHPETVRQTNGKAVFPVVRDSARRGQRGDVNGTAVVFCDNTTPTSTFLWAANRREGHDVQYNHLWSGSKDPDTYTALWNICVTPSFLAKLTDTKAHADTIALLRRRRAGRLPACRRRHICLGAPVSARQRTPSELEWLRSLDKTVACRSRP